MRASYFLAVIMAGAAALCSAQAPKIDKIDPPDWWTKLPSPILLVHGQNLGDAHFTVTGKGVALTRTQISVNGHWAFLWLDTQSATPQTLTIVAKNAQGETHAMFRLAAREHQTSGHAGFSSDDVMYLIMTDRFAQGGSSVDPPGDDRTAPRGWHGGNFAGIEHHIDYLKQLGITAVELLPEWKRQVNEWSWSWPLLAPLVPFLFSWNFAASLITKHIRWRNVRYELVSPTVTHILKP